MDLNKIEKEIVTRLRPINPEKIILFGSYVYGHPDRNSNLDICVITETDTPKSEKKRNIRSLLKGLVIAKDILTPTKDEYEFYKNEIGSVYIKTDKNGKILWPIS